MQQQKLSLRIPFNFKLDIGALWQDFYLECKSSKRDVAKGQLLANFTV